ncbi:MAG: pseudouridine-5'-phosphate glycosidase [Phycisphaerae bacterium]|nr:pseudouridine-5'-phosphate glycosidase [Phycisphaerae bacterium]
MAAIRIHPDVLDALGRGGAVVALETAVLTHGLSRTPMPAPPCCVTFLAGGRQWNESEPANIEVARAMAEAVRLGGAVPATIGMLAGELVVGLTDDELTRLGHANGSLKLSGRDLAVASARRASGGTTVAGTLAAISIANAGGAPAVRVFATGGIGGVHRGWTEGPDVSSDLTALARTPVCVVSAGAKSILDLPATVEALDTLGIPVLGLGTRWFPRFLTAGAPPLAVQCEVATVEDVAAIARAHWVDLRGGGSATGILLANPPPAAWALSLDTTEAIIDESVREARSRGIRAAEVTPFLLGRLAERTGGRSVEANVSSLLHNATVGAALARAMRD